MTGTYLLKLSGECLVGTELGGQRVGILTGDGYCRGVLAYIAENCVGGGPKRDHAAAAVDDEGADRFEGDAKHGHLDGFRF